ncbi:hypothetical protein F5B21DRAFT_479035 [Xylaria acuta]|nr:hypothetical protein F5B21DRAFT_479035 [Xylaria acuta]
MFILRLLGWIRGVFFLLITNIERSLQIFCRSIIRQQSPIVPFHEQSASQHQLLLQLWQMPDKSDTVFIAINLQFVRDDRSQINAIGLCRWYPGLRTMECFHWQIERLATIETQAESMSELFSFGETEFIMESEIKDVLDASFRLPSHIRHVSLVGHDLDAQLGPLKAYWEPPGYVATIDTQTIWQFQSQDENQVSLSEALQELFDDYPEYYQLNHAGNAARCTIDLLQACGRAAILGPELQHFSDMKGK